MTISNSTFDSNLAIYGGAIFNYGELTVNSTHFYNAKKYVSNYAGGIYNNGESGVVDMYGINYYSQEYSHVIMEKVKTIKPLDYQLLLNWLDKSNEYNGFYILGL